jgi:hypothetical protein
MTNHEITLGSITYWAGGFDRTSGRPPRAVGGVRGSWDRLDLLPEVIEQGINPDEPGPRVLFFQQANWFDLNGGELLRYAERLLRPYGRYHGWLTRSDWTVAHCVTFLRQPVDGEPDLDVLHHWDGQDPDEEADRLGFTEVQVGDDGPVLWLRNAMLYPRSAVRRVEQAKQITGAVPDDVVAVVAGSFNSPASGPGEPDRNWELAYRLDPEGALHKGRVLEDGTVVADTSTMDHFLGRWSKATNPRRLGGAGWVSFAQLDGNMEPTVHHDVDKGGPLRINDFVSNRRDILVPGTSRTHPALPHAARRHRYITATMTV